MEAIRRAMKLFLLRWNPAISSWKDADFREALAKSREGSVAMDWSAGAA